MAIQGNKIMNLEDGQVLYNDLRRRIEKNAGVIEEVINTPSAVQTFDDGADGLPMALTVGIEPVQDLHGYENPWPGGGGKNLLQIQTINSSNNDIAVIGNVTFTKITDPDGNVIGVNINASEAVTSNTYCFISRITLPVGSYKIRCFGGVAESYSVRIGKGGTGREGAQGTYVVSVYGEEVTLNVAEQSEYSFAAAIANGKTASNVQLKIMVSPETITDFAPYSNICPISGWTGANVTRVKKQLYNKNTVQTRKYINSSGQVANSTATEDEKALNLTDYFDVEAEKGYTLKAESLATLSGNVTVAFCWFNGTTFMDRSTNAITLGSTSYTFTATAPTGATKARVNFCTNNFDTVVIAESGTIAEYNITFPQLAGTVYGGTLTINRDGSGSLVVDREIVNIADKTWEYQSSNKYFYINVSGAKKAEIDVIPANLISDRYFAVAPKKVVSASGTNLSVSLGVSASRIIIKNTSCTTPEELVAEGGTVVYPLATPLAPVPLNPGQVKTLLGVNNLFADCGSITDVRYPADTKLYIDKKFAELSAAITALGT